VKISLTPFSQSPASVEALLRAGVRLLADKSDSPRLDAEVLLAHALGRSRTALFVQRAEPVSAEIKDSFLAMIHSRQAGRPVAQLTGRREFWSLDLAITPEVLTPRPETEILVERALAHIPQTGTTRMLDLGTGSGAIALALATERPHCGIVATDLSPAALDVARRNARSLAADVRFAAGDWFTPLAGERFDVIVSNPPYIADDEWHTSGPELVFEPRVALAAGPGGLDAIRAIVAAAPEHLSPGGWLLLEHGANQAPAVRELFARAGFGRIATAADLAGRARVTEGCRPA
jgi:release factor glutamine methyltransferase